MNIKGNRKTSEYIKRGMGGSELHTEPMIIPITRGRVNLTKGISLYSTILQLTV